MGKRSRANAEGSIYCRSDRKRRPWVASISLDNGRRKSVYCETQQQAVKELRRLQQEKDQGRLVTKDDTLGRFLTAWLDDTAPTNLRPRTAIRYRELITKHILPTLGNVKLQKLVPQQVQRLYTAKRQEGLAPGTVKNIHMLLHHALNDALKWGLVLRNVCTAVDTPRVPKQERVVLTVMQAQALLEGVSGNPLEALYVLALTTGMREGELLALTWEDVDLTQGKVQVRRSIARVPGEGLVISNPKTLRSRRSIYLTSLAIEALKRHRIRQHEMRFAAGAAWDDQGWIFCNSIGRPIEAASLLTRSFRPLLKALELPPIRFHDLRHTVASFLLMLDVHPKIVQELLGHGQVSLTLDTYSHLLPSLQEEAISRLDVFLTKQG